MKEKGIKILLVISIFLASFLMPFSVSAETINQSNIIGTNVWTTPISTEQFNGYAQNTAIVSVEIQLDQAYLGWINLGVTVNYKNYYYGANNPYWGDTSKTFSGNYYVNGSTVLIEIPISWNSLVSNYQMGSPTHLPDSSSDITLSLSNQSNVTPIGDLSTLQDILDVLTDIKQNVEIDVITELQNIVIKLGLANQYLESISNLRQWNIPTESYSVVQNMLTWHDPTDISVISYFNYPLFLIPDDERVIYFFGQGSKKYTFIFYYDLYFNIDNYSTRFNISNATITSVTLLNERVTIGSSNNGFLYKVEILVNGTSSDNYNVDIKSIYNDRYFIPIYFGSNKYLKYLSTDFALKFGLTNQLLEDLHIISSGTNASNSAASGLENSNSQMASDMNDLATIENDYNNLFDQQLQNIDFSNPIQTHQGILPAANFVISVFNGLINNNPFSVLIIVVCILLIGKKVIGK